SLRYGLITQAVGLLGTLICALTIDHVGRRPWFAVSFTAAAVALAALALFPAPTAEQVLTFMTIAYFFISTINIGVYLYTPVSIDDRTDGGGNDARWRPAVGFCHVRDRRCGRRRDHRRLRGRNQGARAGGGLTLAWPQRTTATRRACAKSALARTV